MNFPSAEVAAVSPDVYGLASGGLIRQLIRRSAELRSMYRLAASQVSEPGLRSVLQENAATLDQVVADLQAQRGVSSAHGVERAVATWHALTQWWALHAAPRGDGGWIRRLARREAAFLAVFERAISHCDGELGLILHRQMPRLRGIDLDMHSLTKAARYSL